VITSQSVIIVGAGPTGLALAAELATAGVRCRVVEKRPERTPWSRAFGLLPRTTELLDLRGRAGAFIQRGLPWTLAPVGDLKHNLDYGRLDSPFPFMVILPQHQTEELLEDWATEAGADVVRGVSLVGLSQDETGVEVRLTDGDREWVESADFVVGCDGAHSSVRELLGVGFHGNTYDSSVVIADVKLTDPPSPAVYARTGKRGMVAVFPFGEQVFRLIVLDHERMHVPVEQRVTLDELRASAGAILGVDLGVHELLWTSRFRSSQRQTDRYRVGRVLLAGDAAHTHIPSGGQGLQVGIQDAMNLGWKLAAEVKGWAAPELLDTYERERRPIATTTLRNTDLMFRYETSQSPAARLVRWLSVRLASIGFVQSQVLQQFAGFTVRYPSMRRDKCHPMVGRRLPDAALHVANAGISRLFELFRDGRFVLVDQTEETRHAELVEEGWSDRVRVARGRIIGKGRLPEAFLVRPDGYVIWASHRDNEDCLGPVLYQWCGEAASVAVGRA
jgi:2-polyprenyl-6-methoxyphenol hydroxylase-like FAD-dependent oxidoreductase